jgi:hypothetical protein
MSLISPFALAGWGYIFVSVISIFCCRGLTSFMRIWKKFVCSQIHELVVLS